MSLSAAVLIRGAEPIEGLEFMRTNYDNQNNNKLTNGPGKLCKALNIKREHNGLDLTGERLYLEDHGYRPESIERSERIGIKKGVEKLWRFYDPESAWVSTNKKNLSENLEYK